MRIPKAIVQKRMGKFLEACREQGVKITHQRLEIYRELASTEEHPDAIMLHRRIRKRMPTVSLDTVYRNLRLLESYGIISIVGMSHERLRFDANMEPHHHFSCIKCAKIIDFQSNRAERLAWPAEAEACGKPLSLRLEVRGVCGNCQKKRNHGKNKRI
jgi:Fur family peroxide stress response transcriptional regulator